MRRTAVLVLLALLGLLPAAAEARRFRRASPLPDLPLHEVHPAVAPRTELLAVLLTGDGGWAATDKGLSAALAARGMPVVGWNSLRYFLHPRNPDGTARDLERILRAYLPLWHRQKVVLIGYSFGADVLPFLVHRLPPDLRSGIALVALLGPDEKAGFRFHLAEWLGKDSKDTLPVRPEIEAIRGLPLLCMYGIQEAHSLCKELDPAQARIRSRPGSHIVGKQYGPIVEEILRMTGLGKVSG